MATFARELGPKLTSAKYGICSFWNTETLTAEWPSRARWTARDPGYLAP